MVGERVPEAARRARIRVGVVPQQDNLDPDFTVTENLQVYGRYFGLDPATLAARIPALLAFAGLEKRGATGLRTLSGGMKRRLTLARALINDPELLILDEPTTGLDPQSRHQVWERLEELRADGLSILLTTHNMDEASRLCDRLIIVDQGRLLVEGKPAELVRRHVGRHVIEIAYPAEGLPAFLSERGAPFENIGHRLIVDLEDGTALYREISERFCDGGGCIMRMATLEDVFLRLTGRELRE
jgi:lipooligosaccharide transport system ATP-binding protein